MGHENIVKLLLREHEEINRQLDDFLGKNRADGRSASPSSSTHSSATKQPKKRCFTLSSA